MRHYAQLPARIDEALEDLWWEYVEENYKKFSYEIVREDHDSFTDDSRNPYANSVGTVYMYDIEATVLIPDEFTELVAEYANAANRGDKEGLEFIHSIFGDMVDYFLYDDVRVPGGGDGLEVDWDKLKCSVRRGVLTVGIHAEVYEYYSRDDRYRRRR